MKEVNESLKRTGNYDLCIKAVEWNLIKQLCKLLAIFNTLCEAASGELVGLSVIQLIKPKIRSACAKNASDYDTIAALKTKILNNLDKRFPLNYFVLTATLFDPASKNKKYIDLSFDDKRTLLLDATKNMNVTETSADNSCSMQSDQSIDVSVSAAGSGSDTEPVNKRLHLLDSFEEDSASTGVMYAAVSQYLSTTKKPSDDEHANLSLYWRNYKYKPLAELARIFLTISASQCPQKVCFLSQVY